MSKARVSWAFQERPVSSTKMNQVVIDYITPALPIWSTFYTFEATALSTSPRLFYPYNPQKSVFNRLYLIGAAVANGSDETDEFDVSFDGGASWTPAFPSVTAAPVTILATTLAETWNLDVQVATFQWIGWRWAGPPVTSSAHLGFIGFLYNSSNTPF